MAAVGGSAMGTHFEELRRQARLLENELETKMGSFARLYKPTTAYDRTSAVERNDSTFDTMCGEIESVIGKLTVINDSLQKRMTEYASQGGGAAASLQHTVQRHRDILHDYRREYQRTRTDYQTQRERELLLTSRSSVGSISTRSRGMDHLAKEQQHLLESDRMLDEQIDMAMGTKEHLSRQRGQFSLISSTLKGVASRSPLMNNLLQKINWRKRRDSIVIAGVVACCLVFMLWWSIS